MTAGAAVRATARPPRSPALRPFVRLVWTYASAGPRAFELVMPGGGGQLLVNLFEDELRHWTGAAALLRRIGPVGLQGAAARPAVIDTDQKREVCGVAFEPGGMTAFCDEPARRFTDTVVDAAPILGRDATVLRDALRRTDHPEARLAAMEAFLLERLRPRPSEDRLLRQVVEALRRGTIVSAVQAAHGLSQRRLHALFDRRIGLRPKLFARIERFAAALDGLQDRASWSELALAHGFADQAHFIREFQRLAGQPPSRHAAVAGEPRHARPPGG